MDEKLNEFFHSLLEGDNSPESLQITLGILDFIKQRSLDIGFIFTIKLNLLKDLLEYNKLWYSLNPKNYREQYKYVIDEKYEYTYDDFVNSKIVFITDDDYKIFNDQIESQIENKLTNPLEDQEDELNEDQKEIFKELKETHESPRAHSPLLAVESASIKNLH